MQTVCTTSKGCTPVGSFLSLTGFLLTLVEVGPSQSASAAAMRTSMPLWFRVCRSFARRQAQGSDH
jgi:hypothetical protein